MQGAKKPNPSHRAPPFSVFTAMTIARLPSTQERDAHEKASVTEGRSMATQAQVIFLESLNSYERDPPALSPDGVSASIRIPKRIRKHRMSLNLEDYERHDQRFG